MCIVYITDIDGLIHMSVWITCVVFCGNMYVCTYKDNMPAFTKFENGSKLDLKICSSPGIFTIQ